MSGYRHVKRGRAEDLRLPGETRSPHYDSAWERNFERICRIWLDDNVILGYRYHPKKVLFLQEGRGNGALEIDFQLLFPELNPTRKTPAILLPLWSESQPHGQGPFECIVEIKGFLARPGGVLRTMPEESLEQLYHAEPKHSSAIKLKRLRSKYPNWITFVVGTHEYHTLRDTYRSRIPAWED